METDLTIDSLLKNVREFQAQFPPLPELKESKYCVARKQFRFPRSKKKRIRKKWGKDDRNFKDVPVAYLLTVPDLSYWEATGKKKKMLVYHPALMILSVPVFC